MEIPFFRTTITGNELSYVQEVLSKGDTFAKKKFSKLAEQWFSAQHDLPDFFLTKSCSHSLELAMLTIGLQPDDEVIMPSYAFVACANAVALRGATCVFVDVLPGTMNLDETKIDAAITTKTKAILTLNYSSIACNYMTIHEIAKRHNLYVIEDNAHGLDAKHDGRFLGTFGDISTFSFDHLKNISCGQGGGIAINNKELLDKFHIHYEFGTNRKIFFQGGAERYEWKNVGSNYLLSELNAAMLYAQLEIATSINAIFVKRWKQYAAALEALVVSKKIELPLISKKDLINGHCFFIKTKNQEERSELISFLQTQNIQAQFHYVPLHKSEFGKRAGRFAGEDTYTTNESSRLLRLPLFYNITEEEVNYVAESIKEFYR